MAAAVSTECPRTTVSRLGTPKRSVADFTLTGPLAEVSQADSGTRSGSIGVDSSPQIPYGSLTYATAVWK